MSRPAEPARTHLVESAERLFAERGIEAVSLRDVCAAAGQRNHSAAQYHFGDRGGLVTAVFANRMAQVNTRRHAMLDQADGADLPAIVGALVVPLAEVVFETDGWYGRFLARTSCDTFAQAVLADLPETSSARRAGDMLQRHLRHLRAALRAARLEQIHTLLNGSFAAWEWQRDRNELVLDCRTFVNDLITTICAVVSAPANVRHDATAASPLRASIS